VDTVILADVSVWQLVGAICLAMALAACSGLRALLPLLLTGIVVRAGLIEVGKPFHFLGTNWALLLFGIATVLEIAADKIPAVDHALDVVHTVLRPLSGSVLAAAVLSRVSDPATAVALGIVVGAPTALVPHAAKATLRVVSTALTGGLANPVISIAEDLATVVLFVLAVVVPALVALLILGLTVLIVRRLMKMRRRAPAAA
jgi:hypothetical protein